MFNLSEDNKNYYKIIKQKEVVEHNILVVELEHLITGAKIVLFICDDENRVFNIAFKTPVENGKGIPHILEHSVLCGSRKYNVKDPFIELAKGSMNTFLNAMTFPDKTCYPVASANLKDFHNLVDVYLDAVFYPNAVKDDKIFKQEGWHYEIENKDDDLKVNGVVYNEMKGVYSDPDSILESAILANLFCGTNYAYESGGKPDEIIDLKFDEFVDFHKKYYSATNSIINLYGKLDYNYELIYLHDNYLKNMEKVDLLDGLSSVEKVVHNLEVVDYYNIDSDDTSEKSYIAYSFVIPYKKSSLYEIVLRIIDYVLFSSDSAIIKEKLMNEGLGKNIVSNYETGIKNSFFTVIAKEIDDIKKDKFISEIVSSIKDIVYNGLDIDKFKAGINAIYFSYAEGEYGRTPRGLLISLTSLETYLYGEDSTTLIEYKEAFDYLNSIDLSDKNNIFIKTLKDVFLKNNWTAVNILKPRKNFSKEKDEKLAKILNERKEQFGSERINDIIDDVKALKEFQTKKDSEDNLKSIPMLKISDIDRHKNIIDYKHEKIFDTDSVIFLKNEKDICYLRVGFDITNFTKEELYFCAIINQLIARIDLDKIDFKELNNYIDINTGGLTTTIDIYDKKSIFAFSIKSVKDKINIVFDILYKVLSSSIFEDKKRIELLLNETKSISLLTILSSGHSSAVTRSKSTLEFASYVGDKVSKSGIGFYRFINELCKKYNDESKTINEILYLVFKKIVSSNMYLEVSSNEKYLDNIKNEFIEFKERLNDDVIDKININSLKVDISNKLNDIKKFIHFDDFDKLVNREAIVTSNDINFCAIAGKFDEKLYSGRLILLRTLFNYEYLWTNIRVLGGAYGCMSVFQRTGTYSFVSYRDPNVINTNKIFFEVPSFLSSVNKKEDEINKYIIGSIGIFDNPVSTYDSFLYNVSAFFNKISDEDINKVRLELLDMKPADLNELSTIFDDISNSSACALIAENKIDDAKKEYDDVWRLMEE